MIVEAWEERVSKSTAHLMMDSAKKKYLEYAIEKIDFNDQIVVDYGCGSGYLGEIILNQGAREYIGIDISSRAIEMTKERLKKYKNYRLIDLESDDNILLPEGDIFICLNVIQHFPSEKYFKKWIKKVNLIGYKKIILNFRDGEVLFKFNPYKNMHDIIFANTMNKEYIGSYMTNYKLYDTIQTGDFVILEMRYDK